MCGSYLCWSVTIASVQVNMRLSTTTALTTGLSSTGRKFIQAQKQPVADNQLQTSPHCTNVTELLLLALFVLLHFVRVADDAKCILVTHICLSVCSHMPTLLPPSCALLGGFAIGARVHCYGNIAQMQNVSECLYSHYTWLLLLAGWLGFNGAFNKT